jgi:4-hydroxybenzoate polyprenyltransferase
MKDFLILIRIQTITKGPLFLLFGAILATGVQLSWNYLLLAIAGIFIHIQVYGWNDYLDAEYDKTKKYLEGKPLVSNKLEKSKVLLYLSVLLLPLLIIVFSLDYGYLLLLPLGAGLMYDIFSKKTHYAGFFAALCSLLGIIVGAIIAGGELTTIILLASLYLGLETLFIINILGALKDKDDLYAVLGFRKLTYVGSVMRLISIAILIFLVVLVGITIPVLIIFILCAALLMASSVAIFREEYNDHQRLQFLRWMTVNTLVGLAMLPIILAPLITMGFALLFVTIPIIWFILCNKLLTGTTLPKI